MRNKINPKHLILILLLSCLPLSFLLRVQASNPLIVSGSNFQIYSTANGKIAFQHLATEWITAKGCTVTLTVDSGTLNGTNSNLKMYSTSGILTFKNRETTTISFVSTLPGITHIKVNGESYSAPVSLLQNQNVTIVWNYSSPVFLLPLMFIFGMVGLLSTFFGPIYAIFKVKHGEYYEGFRSGLVVTAVGIALVIAWLWG